MGAVDWSKRVQIDWDERHRQDTELKIPGVKVPAGPPLVASRRALWSVSTSFPHVFAHAYRWPFDSVTVNAGLKGRRGRTVVATALDEAGQMPLAVMTWHLSQAFTEPLLVVAAAPRAHAPEDLAGQAIIDAGFVLLVDVLLHVAAEHRAWALPRISGSTARRRAEGRLGDLWFDVEGQPALAAFLDALFGDRLSVGAKRGAEVVHLRLRP